MNTKDSVSSIDHFAPAAGLLRWAEAQPGRRYENQAVIYHSGEDAGQFYCLIDGKVQIYMTSPEGIENRSLSIRTMRCSEKPLSSMEAHAQRPPARW